MNASSFIRRLRSALGLGAEAARDPLAPIAAAASNMPLEAQQPSTAPIRVAPGVLNRTLVARMLFLLLIVAYFAYGMAFIEHTTHVIGSTKYYTLFDDMMVSMRYAKNLAHGYGLVWNPGGERVEGFTNPLWVGYMALIHLFPIPEEQTSFYVQITSLILLILDLWLVKQIVDLITGGSFLAWASAVIMTATYLPLINWALQGTEVGLQACSISLSLWLMLRSYRAKRFSALPYVTLGIGLLVRLDMGVTYAIVLGISVLSDAAYRRQHLRYGIGMFLAFFVPQTLFRFFYYNDYLPNTYYLKIVGFPLADRLSRGFNVTQTLFTEIGWVPFSLLVVKRSRSVILLFAVVLAQMLYNVYAGGDAWEWWGGANRYVSVVMPIFFVLFGCALWGITKYLAVAVKQLNEHSLVSQITLWVGCVLLVLFSFLQANEFAQNEKDQSLQVLAFQQPALHVNDDDGLIRRALLIDAITTDQAKVAVVWAGIIPYFSNRESIDILGKTDRYIAHLPNGDPWYQPGHMKWDYTYSIGRLKPDIIQQIWGNQSDAQPYLDRYYMPLDAVNSTLYLRTDSPNILWDQIPDAVSRFNY